MKLKNMLIILSSLGFGFGVIIGVIITAIVSTNSVGDGEFYFCSKEFLEFVGNPVLAFSLQALGCGIQGALAMGGAVIYDIEDWGITKCTLIHYLIILVSYCILGLSVRWFSINDISEMILVFILMTAGFFCIWMVLYISSKIQLKRLNKKLDALKKSEDKNSK